MPLYDGLWAIDPSNPENVAISSEVTIFDPADASHAPIELTDPDGLNIANPLTTNDKGFVGAFRADLKRIGWDAAGLVGYIGNYDSVAEDASTALALAGQADENAASAVVAAQEAASLVDAPSDEIIALLAGNPESLTHSAVDAATGALIGTDGSDVQVAADGRYTKRGEDRVLVTDFGAMGDGATVNDVAFNAAIAFAYGTFGQGGKTVVFPAGEYVTYQRINLKGNLQYEAYGATFRKPNTAAGYAVFYTRSNGAQGYGSGNSNIIWRGGTFRGDFSVNNMICPFGLHHTDNFEAYDFECYEVQGTGHTFDMLGCSNIRIHDFKMFGFKNTSTGGYQKSECIQIDLSAESSSSAPDTAGSYDGLMTRDVHVTRGLFSSITVGGVFYPAPNPIGSHAQHESRIPTNIRFDYNVLVNPMQDSVSGVYGAIHFIGGDGISIDDNIIYYTAESPNKSTTLAGLYSTDWGVPLATAQYEAGASNTLEALADPIAVRNVSMARNRVWGVQADSTRHLFAVTNKSDSTAPVYAENVVIDSPDITVTGGSSALNAFNLAYVDGLYFKGKAKVSGPVRPINSASCKNISVDDLEVSGSRSDAVRFDNFDGLRIKSITTKSSAGTSLYLSSGTNLEVLGGFYDSLAGSRAVAITGVSIFQVANVRTKSPAGVIGVQVYGASINGYVDKVIATGGATQAVTNSGTNVEVGSTMVI